MTAHTPVTPDTTAQPIDIDAEAQVDTPARTLGIGQASKAASRGMSLIEILIVLAIIGMIMGGIAVYAGGAFSGAQADTTKNDITNLENLVGMYKIKKKGACPKSLADLKTAGILKKVKDDAWGTAFQLECPGKHGDVDISSAGPDKKFGTDDDIGNWDAEKQDSNE